MKGGREMDARIAREVMELDPLRAGPDDMIFTTDRDYVLPGEYWYVDDAGGNRHVPSYSTDIGSAWLVVDAMYAKGFNVGVSKMHDWRAPCECCIYPPDKDGRDLIAADGNTPAHAICLAALKALGS